LLVVAVVELGSHQLELETEASAAVAVVVRLSAVQ
jgi:hypothetical protein